MRRPVGACNVQTDDAGELPLVVCDDGTMWVQYPDGEWIDWGAVPGTPAAKKVKPHVEHGEPRKVKTPRP